MRKTLRRSISVFIAVAITTLCVYGVVRVGGAVFPAATAAAFVADTSAGENGVPTGQNGAAVGRSNATAGQGAPASGRRSKRSNRPNAQPAQSNSSGSARLYRCPVSGCTATSCHGATGAPPPSR